MLNQSKTYTSFAIIIAVIAMIVILPQTIKKQWSIKNGNLEDSISRVIVYTKRYKYYTEFTGVNSACIQHFLEFSYPNRIEIGFTVSRSEIIDYAQTYAYGKTQYRCSRIVGKLLSKEMVGE
jgi:hypothetical protein